MAANPLIDMGDQAAANTRSNVAQENNNIVADQQRQTLPYSMAIKGLQDKLQTIDQKANPQDYNDTVDKIQQNIRATGIQTTIKRTASVTMILAST